MSKVWTPAEIEKRPAEVASILADLKWDNNVFRSENKQLQAENEKLREYICEDCEGRGRDNCNAWVKEKYAGIICPIEAALKGE